MKKFHRYFSYLVLVLISAAISITFANEKSGQVQSTFNQGQFTEAITQWEKILPTLPQNQQIEVYLQLASAYQSLGFINQAQEYLKQAWFLTRQFKDKVRESLVLGSLSDSFLLKHEVKSAEDYAQQSVKLARQSQSPLASATALNYLGNVLSIQKYYPDALQSYQASLKQLQLEDDAILRAKVLGNMVQIEFRDTPPNLSHFEEALSHTRSLPVSHDQIFGLIKLGHLILTYNTPQAKEILREALAIAKQLPDKMGIIYATGYLGEVAEKETQYVEAETLTKQTISFTQQYDVSSGFCKIPSVSSVPELMYQWQWQLGRLKKIQNELEGALVAYQLAADNLQCIQPMMIRGNYRYPPQSFYENAGKIYFELADLQLQLAHSITEESARQSKLKAARETLERLKVTELQNYFREDCVTVAEDKYKKIDEVIKDKDNAHTAILYPMIFPNRVELLLSLPDKPLKQFRVDTEDAKENQLSFIIEDFLGQLKKKPNNGSHWLRRKAIRLFEVFIRPIEKDLESSEKIDTLVIVPDKLLRTIPFAAFYDETGKQFLIQRYALAITPGLALIDPKPRHRLSDTRMLIAGLSKAVQGAPALGDEGIAMIQAIKNKKVCPEVSFVSLENQEFKKERVKQELERNYTIVDLNTHGYFGKNPQESFVLVFDDKLSLDDLDKLFRPNLLRKIPVELLTLSACQTATGNEQAALGLAGVTVKVGVRSAVGSLWKVDNQATAQLMKTFFSKLCDNSTLSKAKALQAAQKELLKEKPHPYYWAAFLLIGNWL